MRNILTTFIIATVFAAAQTPQVKPAAELATLGPQVGDRVPEFELKDQAGRTHTLKSVLGPNGAMIVFYRSASW